jgi:peptide/nickel transport system substrate-binding protein
VIAESVFGFNDQIRARERDVARARELMEEAGYSEDNQLSFTIWTNGENLNRQAIAQIIQQDLREIYIYVEVNTLEFAAFMESREAGETESAIAGWIAITADADYAMYPLFHSTSHGESGNTSYFVNARVDELLDATRATTDAEARLAYFREAQEIIYEEVPMIPLQQPPVIVVSRNNVRGFNVNPNRSHFYGNVYFVD